MARTPTQSSKSGTANKNRLDKLLAAVEIWQKNTSDLKLDGPTGIYHYMAFTTVIGFPYDGTSPNIVPIDNPRVMHIIDLILSENGAMIVKMLNIRHAERKKAYDEQSNDQT